MSWVAGAGQPAVKTTYGRKKAHNPATSTMFLSVQSKAVLNRPSALHTIEEGDENPFSSSSSKFSSTYDSSSEISSTPLRDRGKNAINVFSPPSSESSSVKKTYSKRKDREISSSAKTDRKAIRHDVESSPVSSFGRRGSSKEENSFDLEVISKSSTTNRYQKYLLINQIQY
jgi:hypothetical protein